MDIVCILLQIAFLIVIARVILEWIPVSFDHPVARVRSILRSLTEPVLAPLRAIIPPVRMGGVGLDLSPIILFIGLSILMQLVC